MEVACEDHAEAKLPSVTLHPWSCAWHSGRKDAASGVATHVYPILILYAGNYFADADSRFKAFEHGRSCREDIRIYQGGH
jgi:hypothetical protein